MLQIGPEDAWLWVAIEPIHKQILGVYFSRHRNMIVTESFLRSLIKIYGKQEPSVLKYPLPIHKVNRRYSSGNPEDHNIY
jgi:transposase-like protein